MSSIGTSGSTCSNLTAAASPDASLFSTAVECARVGAERLAGFRIEINHVAATIELELGAAGWVKRRHVIENIARHGIRRDHVGITMRNQKTERRIVGKQRAD